MVIVNVRGMSNISSSGSTSSISASSNSSSIGGDGIYTFIRAYKSNIR